MGRTIGFILIGAGLALLAIIVLWVGVNNELAGPAAILGIGLGLFVVLPLLGAGVYTLVRGNQEAAQMAEVKEQRKLLSIVKTQGEIDLADLVFEMGSSRDAVKGMLYDLVGKGLYSGYINWEKGVLYSAEASQLKELTNCRNCGGEIKLAGKGVVACPYCGTEYFLN